MARVGSLPPGVIIPTSFTSATLRHTWTLQVYGLLIGIAYVPLSNWRSVAGAWLLIPCMVVGGHATLMGLSSRFPTLLTNEGVNGYDSWGQPVSTSWEALDYRGITNRLLPRYFRIYCPRERRMLNIPLALQDQAGSLACVAARLGEEHPFTRALRDEWKLPVS